MISVRKAQDKDIKRVTELLAQVLELHADLRPDLFIHGTVKYTENQLSDIFADEKTPVFVAVDDKYSALIPAGICVLYTQRACFCNKYDRYKNAVYR